MGGVTQQTAVVGGQGARTTCRLCAPFETMKRPASDVPAVVNREGRRGA